MPFTERYKHCNKCRGTYLFLYYRKINKYKNTDILYCPNCDRIRILDRYKNIIKEIRLNGK